MWKRNKHNNNKNNKQQQQQSEKWKKEKCATNTKQKTLPKCRWTCEQNKGKKHLREIKNKKWTKPNNNNNNTTWTRCVQMLMYLLMPCNWLLTKFPCIPNKQRSAIPKSKFQKSQKIKKRKTPKWHRKKKKTNTER